MFQEHEELVASERLYVRVRASLTHWLKTSVERRGTRLCSWQAAPRKTIESATRYSV